MLLGEMMHRFKTTVFLFSRQKQNAVTLTRNCVVPPFADVLELHVL